VFIFPKLIFPTGLTLLLPYIISTRHSWASCKLRVFALANRKEELEFEQRNIASLLAKFRIDYADLIIITTITRRPHEETVEFYNHLVRPYLAKDEEADCGDAGDMVLDNYKAMCILRVKGGFDYSSVLADTDPLSRNGVTTPPESLSRNVSASQFSH
ncbi:bumetanide-sensitive sodium-(potassium)-chloride cotransporter-like, partial [Diaphorina citri]|uniref:Bumetanide-sensitive sodium-(Potassium)-chloride cotransporter-like n=1 Tax=Diaphorina citri TaxID=121845 RepID=A0A3Q0JIH4_DIACI